MKKITSILMLFLMCYGMAVQAGPTDLPQLTEDSQTPKLYTIKNVKENTFANYAGDAVKMTQVAVPTTSSLFYFTGSINDGVAMVKIHNFATDNLCAEHNSWTAEGRDWYIGAKTTTGLSISKTEDFSGNNSWNDFQGAGKEVDYWNATDGGSIWVIESVEDQIHKILGGFETKFIGTYKEDVNAKAQLSASLEKIQNGDNQGAIEFLNVLQTLEVRQPELGKTYVVQSAYPGYYEKQHVLKGLFDEGTKPQWGDLDKSQQKFLWTIDAKDNGFTFNNVSTGKYIKALDANTNVETEAAVLTMKSLGENQLNLLLRGSKMHTEGHSNGNGVSGNIVSWDDGFNSASAWYIYESDFDPIVTVSYNYLLNGEIVKTINVDQFVGDRFILPYINDGFTATLETEGYVSAANNEVNVVCVEKIPFQQTQDIDNPILYSVRIKKAYLWNADASTEVKASTTSDYYADFEKPAYQWFFMGNAVTGFKIYNVAQGTSVALSNTSDQASFVAAESAISWTFKRSRTNANQLCFFDGTNTLNLQGGILKYWWDTDDGSSLDFFDIAYNLSMQVVNAANALKYIPSGAVGSYDYFNDKDNVAKFNDAISKVEANYSDAVAREELKSLLKEAKETAVVAFDDNKLYRIKNIRRMLSPQGSNSNWDRDGHGGYIGSTPYAGNKTELTCGTEELNDAGTVWQFVQNGEGYYLKNLNNGKFIGHHDNQVDGAVAMYENSSDAGTYKFEAIGNAQYKLDVNGQKLHVSTGKFMYYDNNDPASKWYLVPATELEVSLNEAENATWASLYLPFDVNLPVEMEAYTGKLNSSSLSMTKVTEVPANNGVILKGTQSKYSLAITSVVSANQLDNDLKGTNVTKEIADMSQFFVLGNGTAGVGLYNPNVQTLKANRAYLEAGVAAQILKFDFNGEATGVEGVVTENAKAFYYDLSGRRVANPVKGIYIKNGKKVYVK